ncbi:MAG TPA: diguanylate cyclase, partial [Longimicrobium sp.]|nr:diguanylate cyclase [Longimicrobium sp.]
MPPSPPRTPAPPGSRWPALAAQALGAPAAGLRLRLGRGRTREDAEGAEALLPALRAVLEHVHATGDPYAADSLLAVPVVAPNGRAAGALGVAGQAGRAWTQDEVDVLRGLASGAAAEIAAHRAMLALRESQERFRAMFERAPIGVLLVDMKGRCVDSNRAFRQMVRLSRGELRRMHFWELNHPDDNPGNLALWQDLVEGRRDAYQMEKRYLLRDGSIVWVHLATSVVRDTRGRPRFCVAMVENVSERKGIEERLRHDVHHDGLTGLPNRTLFLQRLAEAGASVDEHGEPRRFAVLFLDLDRFKVVNDSLGHLVGDELLRVVAARLRACVRTGDTVARFGGDEFVLLLDGVGDSAVAARRAEELQAALSAPVDLGGYEVFTSASIGIALSSEAPPGMPEHLLRNADAAMYRARNLGAQGHAIFDRSMHNEAMRRLQLETELRLAVRRGEFRLAYQPVVELVTGRIAGWEALVRWEHPERGLVAPGDFIGVAEDTGLIVPLGRYVLNEACRQLRAWHDDGRGGFVAVNLSARQFMDASLVPFVEGLVRELDLPAGCLKVELTESIVMRDPQATTALLRRLRDLGMEVY